MRVSVVGSALCWDPAWSRETAPFPVPQAGWQGEEKVLVVLCLLQQREGRRIFVCGGTRMSSCSIGGMRKSPLPLALKELWGFACFNPPPSLGGEELPSSRAPVPPSVAGDAFSFLSLHRHCNATAQGGFAKPPTAKGWSSNVPLWADICCPVPDSALSQVPEVLPMLQISPSALAGGLCYLQPNLPKV